MEPMHEDVILPAFPDDPGEALPALCKVLEGLIDQAEPGASGWSVEPEASGGEVSAYGSRVADGLRFSVSVVGECSDEEPPSHWVLAADVSRVPVATQADKVMGAVAVGLCLVGGVAAGGGVFWLLADYSVIAWLVALPVGLLANLACLVAAVFVTPRSAQPPVPAEVREGWLRAMEGGVETLIEEGRLLRSGEA